MGVLQGVLLKLRDDEVLQELSVGRNGQLPPKMFASPRLAWAAITHLSTQGVTLGRKKYLLKHLKGRHIIVEDHLLRRVCDILNDLPGGDNVHVRNRNPISVD